MACHLIFVFITQSPNLDHLATVRLQKLVPCVPDEERVERTIISTRHHTASNLSLGAGGPDVLQVAVTLSEAVEGVIALTAGTDETAESVGLVLTGVAAVLVNLADGQLDGGVVVGLDDAVGGAALAGHVAVEKKRLC